MNRLTQLGYDFSELRDAFRQSKELFATLCESKADRTLVGDVKVQLKNSLKGDIHSQLDSFPGVTKLQDRVGIWKENILN